PLPFGPAPQDGPRPVPTEREALDQAPAGRTSGARRLALRVRARCREARAPDQLLLPQPRRGHLRRVPAADGRHGFEELPEDRPGRDRRRQDQVPLPRVAREREGAVARILLGVSGGISAYKAVELARLAIKAGHAVRVVETESAERFVGRATFEGITGAPVLVSEFEPDSARGAYPGDPAP